MRNEINANPKIFLLWSDEINARLDPLYYAGDILDFIRNSKFEIVDLGSVITFIKAGFAAGKQDQDETEGGIVQIRPTNINEFGSLKFDKTILLPKTLLDERPQDVIQKGEILFNNTNSQELVGKTAYFDIDGNYFCSNHITRIRTDEKKLLPGFLWLLLNTYQARNVFYKICVNWNNQSGVNVELLKTLQIPLPSLQKQKEAIEFINKAYVQKLKKEQEIKKILASIDNFVLDELGIELPSEKASGGGRHKWIIWSDQIKKRLDPVFFHPARLRAVEAIMKSGQHIVSLSEIAEFRREIVDKIPESVPYLGLENISSNSGEYIENGEKESVSSAFVFKRGDVLFPKLRPYLNKVFYADFEGVCSTEFHVLRARECDPFYLFAFLSRSVVVEQTSRLMTGNTLPRLQTEDVENLLVPIPSLEKQEKITSGVQLSYLKIQALQAEVSELLAGARKQVEQMILS